MNDELSNMKVGISMVGNHEEGKSWTQNNINESKKFDVLLFNMM